MMCQPYSYYVVSFISSIPSFLPSFTHAFHSFSSQCRRKPDQCGQAHGQGQCQPSRPGRLVQRRWKSGGFVEGWLSTRCLIRFHQSSPYGKEFVVMSSLVVLMNWSSLYCFVWMWWCDGSSNSLVLPPWTGRGDTLFLEMVVRILCMYTSLSIYENVGTFGLAKIFWTVGACAGNLEQKLLEGQPLAEKIHPATVHVPWNKSGVCALVPLASCDIRLIHLHHLIATKHWVYSISREWNCIQFFSAMTLRLN